MGNNGTNSKGDQRGCNENSLANLKKWKPGQSGNPRGRPPGPDLIRLIREELAKVVTDDKGEKRTVARKLIQVILKGAMKGNHQQQRMIMNYLHGLPKATLEVTQNSMPFEDADSDELLAIITSARVIEDVAGDGQGNGTDE